ncbi:response regulator transcription factor [Variovorax sp. NFACC27]|uniref:Response regulator transcription factor n=1 Tax=Variovorax gossypii TaxID=1679495 RepID=A0A431TK18_9BURK|nr:MULTISPECIES: response regulator transcription factor [Variovorax]SEF26585.1 DNA-binding response regulator, NarL/FixJ family, contains REC and HTH domains [Variovorax sp. NFACC28]SEG58959.1 DNA-binding response regulator, NarL/FixJ family, contains REC and HTH domains [Variovorax sp. NFACC29]SFC58095.1 DNA-binding response regulator, NarL/FixJ family, contains REC and HTH domains [Variovorax sp. NFACC26]SFG66239.1 DNA-binding response regulator, NarL/FixJ family, contains REC and HTH domain
MKVLLVDDHEIVWNGTRLLLERMAAEIEPGRPFHFEAVRDAEQACRLDPVGVDLLLLDYHLPQLSGLAALKAVKAHFEATPVCMQSAESSPQRVREVIEAGAAGFIPKSYRLEDMEAALRVVLRHRIYLPAEFVLADDVTRAREPDELPREDLAGFLRVELSPRQRQVLALAMRGMPVKLIARQLMIAEGTVKVHLSMVYRALGARNRTDALCRVFDAQAAWALEAA